jgi:CubicO group peptidase (beta-lactamase class C family)
MTIPVHAARRRRALVAVTAATAVLAAGCAGSAADPAAASAPPPSAPPAYAAQLQPQLEQLARDLMVTGAVVQVRSPQRGDWTTTIGTTTYRGTEPVQVADHIRIGSVTKSWTGTVVLQLVDEGRLRLDDPVAKYRADVPNGENITIEQMLSMRSGLGNCTTDPAVNERQDADPSAVFEPEELIRIGLAMPVKFPPGQGFFYSNTNTVLLGRIVEQITGNPLATEFQRRIFTKIGMGQSSFPAITEAALPDPHPQGYTYGTNVETIASNALSPEKQAAARAGTLADGRHSGQPIVGVERWSRHLDGGRSRPLRESTGRRRAAEPADAEDAAGQRPADRSRSSGRSRVRPRAGPVRPLLRPHRRAAGVQHVHRVRPADRHHCGDVGVARAVAGRPGPGRPDGQDGHRRARRHRRLRSGPDAKGFRMSVRVAAICMALVTLA